jgi:hypothetical protein
VIALAAAAPAVAAFDPHPTNRAIRRDLTSSEPARIARRADLAVASLVRAASIVAWQRGEYGLSERWVFEYERDFRGFLEVMTVAEGLGDHRPLSEWLQRLHDELEAILGPTLMAALHFDDIKTFNHGTPVVFGMRKFLGVEIDEAEYGLHWVPWCGVVSYWGVWAACQAATWGGGWFVVCTPAGMIAERVTVKWVAPPLTDDAWRVFWKVEDFAARNAELAR